MLFENPWPTTTHVWCFHCCHPFDGTGIPLPCRYVNGKFYVKNVYCSWNCLKAANLAMVDSNKYHRSSLIQLMYYKMHNVQNNIKPAPPREALKVFGGTLSIDDFRSSSELCLQAIFPPLENINPSVEKSVNFSWVKQSDANKNFELFRPDSVPNNSVRIKNKANKNGTLEATMGLFTSNGS